MWHFLLGVDPGSPWIAVGWPRISEKIGGMPLGHVPCGSALVGCCVAGCLSRRCAAVEVEVRLVVASGP